MDVQPLAIGDLRSCLEQLASINRVSFGYRPTLAWLGRLLPLLRGRTLSVLDIGCGHGDTLRRIRRWADHHGIALELQGIDINPWAGEIARAATPQSLAIEYETSDVFDLPCDRKFDLIICSLFAHHLDDQALKRFLLWMKDHAIIGWFVNDLRRTKPAYAAVRALVALMNPHPVVRHDGPLSVRRALTREEWRQITDEAGFRNARLRQFFPFRIGIAWCHEPSPQQL